MITITLTGETMKDIFEKLIGALEYPASNAIQIAAPVVTQAAPAPVAYIPVAVAASTQPAVPVSAPAQPQYSVPMPDSLPAPPQRAQTPAAPVTPPPPPPVPTAQAPAFTLDQITRAGADLITAKPEFMSQLMAMLPKYGVQTLAQLKPEQFGAVAAELRQLGAKI